MCLINAARAVVRHDPRGAAAQAGDQLRDAEDPLLRLRGVSGVCEILTDTGDADRSEGDCTGAEALADIAALAYERMRVQNLRLAQRFNPGRFEEAIAYRDRAQALAREVGLATARSGGHGGRCKSDTGSGNDRCELLIFPCIRLRWTLGRIPTFPCR